MVNPSRRPRRVTEVLSPSGNTNRARLLACGVLLLAAACGDASTTLPLGPAAATPRFSTSTEDEPTDVLSTSEEPPTDDNNTHQTVITTAGGRLYRKATFEGGNNRAFIHPDHDFLVHDANMKFPGWLTLIDSDAGGSGSFAYEPSASTVAFWSDAQATASREIRFVRPVCGVSLYYSSTRTVSVTAFNAANQMVAATSGPAQHHDPRKVPLGDPTGSFNNWTRLAVDVCEGAGNVIVRVVVTGINGGTAIDDVESAEILNAAPVASAGGPYAGNEGDAVSLSAAGSSDPDGGPLSYAWDLDNDGDYADAADAALDGSGAGAAGVTASRVYPDNGPFRVGVRVSDPSGASGTSVADVAIANVAPEITAITAPVDPIQLVSGSAAAAVGVAFTDPGADSHVTTIQCGNGTTATAGTCTYSEAGVYTVTVTVTETDPEGASDTGVHKYIVVYDPSAGFVTGGGWIAYDGVACPDLCAGVAGRAEFGFVSIYTPGASTPTGGTSFEFHAGALAFVSTTYDWLVVGGSRARFKGAGTINGGGNYTFMLTAVDGTPDKFRIKITDAATGIVVFDNQVGADEIGDSATALDMVNGGGSIVIHKN